MRPGLFAGDAGQSCPSPTIVPAMMIRNDGAERLGDRCALEGIDHATENNLEDFFWGRASHAPILSSGFKRDGIETE